jgi:ribosomal protein L44E
MKTKIEYEAQNGTATKEYLDKRNWEIYERRLNEISKGKFNSFNDEKDFYLEIGPPLKKYTRTIAIRRHCAECSGQSSEKIDCDLKWGKYYSGVYPEGCPLNPWTRGVRYIPAGSQKITQKKAIMLRCRLCQGGGTLENVRQCPNFLYVDENGNEQGCSCHPYRYGANPWYGTKMTEEEKEEFRERLAKMRDKKKKGAKHEQV